MRFGLMGQRFAGTGYGAIFMSINGLAWSEIGTGDAADTF
jgi:hypothetical protein